MAYKNILASSISHVPHLAAFDELWFTRLEGIDLTPVLAYSISTVPASVLFLLAQQFDVTGPGGWDLALTDPDKRKLIAGAIELHRYKGTPFAVKESLKRVGFADVKLIEHVSLGSVLYNGVYTHNGSQTYGGGFWADFRVEITVPDSVPLSVSDVDKIKLMVNSYKNVRSRLVDITFALLFEEMPVITEESSEGIDATSVPDYATFGAYYDGSYLYDGGQTHNKGADTMELKIFENGILISTENI